MVLKTFNLDKEVYDEFSKHCRENGISMSKRVDNFMRNEVENLKINMKNNSKITKTKIKESFSNDKHPLEKYC